MKSLRVGIFVVIVGVLTACASLGLPAPKSFSDRVNYADSTLTAVNNATATSLDAHQLTSAEAKSVREIAVQAKSLLDSARAASGTAAGDQNLTLAVTVLQQLQTYLNNRGKT